MFRSKLNSTLWVKWVNVKIAGLGDIRSGIQCQQTSSRRLKSELFSLIFWLGIELNQINKEVLTADYQKRTSTLWWRTFHNKVLIRDTITIWSNATKFARFIKFWSSEHDHKRICDGFIYSQRLTETEWKTPDTTNIGTY